MALPKIDQLHDFLRKHAQTPALQDGSPAFLFRAERAVYDTTYSSIDREYHAEHVSDEAYSQLADLTAYAMRHVSDGFAFQDAKTCGAFAQHYGFPTQVFDFTSSPEVAIWFAANKSYHKEQVPVGRMGILDVAAAREGKACELFDLRGMPGAKRPDRQQAFGLIYTRFIVDDHVDVKRPEIAKTIGLKWYEFSHLPSDEAYLHVTGNDDDLLAIAEDEHAAQIPEAIVDSFVDERGPLLSETATWLAAYLPSPTRTKEHNLAAWT